MREGRFEDVLKGNALCVAVFVLEGLEISNGSLQEVLNDAVALVS